MTHTTANHPTLGTADTVIAGVLSLVGVHAHALNALLTVASVEWNDDIETACVECVERPRLLLNPAFVQRWCHTPERLAALVLHELLHIALGHTRLFPRPTALHNVAFDAIINRTVLATLGGTRVDVHRYADLFTDFYSASHAPHFLLRPPPGWPHAPVWSASRGMPEPLRRIHRQLYDIHAGTIVGHASGAYMDVTYGDIIQALRESGECASSGVPLLGAHGVGQVERAALAGTRDVHAAEALSEVLSTIRGQLPGRGGALGLTAVANVERTPSLVHAIRALLRKAASRRSHTRGRMYWDQRPVRVVHRLHDRRATCRVRSARLLGAPAPMLFDGHVLQPRPEPVAMNVYLDVSGSMDGLLPHLRRALLSLRREIDPTLYLFSTVVVPAAGDSLESGQLPSTGGTEIGAVIDHAVQHLPAGTAAVVLTDGYFGIVSARSAAALRKAGIALHLGVMGGGPLHEKASWVASSVRLPSPRS